MHQVPPCHFSSSWHTILIIRLLGSWVSWGEECIQIEYAGPRLSIITLKQGKKTKQNRKIQYGVIHCCPDKCLLGEGFCFDLNCKALLAWTTILILSEVCWLLWWCRGNPIQRICLKMTPLVFPHFWWSAEPFFSVSTLNYYFGEERRRKEKSVVTFCNLTMFWLSAVITALNYMLTYILLLILIVFKSLRLRVIFNDSPVTKRKNWSE